MWEAPTLPRLIAAAGPKYSRGERPLRVGGAPGFMPVTGKALGISPLIGILMRMGIAAKNSILLVEHALVAEKERRMSRFEALLDAARKRARPIVMTATAVIGGLISSTVRSLVHVPVVRTVVDDLQRFRGRHLSRLLVERSDAGRQAATATPAKDPDHAYPV